MPHPPHGRRGRSPILGRRSPGRRRRRHRRRRHRRRRHGPGVFGSPGLGRLATRVGSWLLCRRRRRRRRDGESERGGWDADRVLDRGPRARRRIHHPCQPPSHPIAPVLLPTMFLSESRAPLDADVPRRPSFCAIFLHTKRPLRFRHGNGAQETGLRPRSPFPFCGKGSDMSREHRGQDRRSGIGSFHRRRTAEGRRRMPPRACPPPDGLSPWPDGLVPWPGSDGLSPHLPHGLSTSPPPLPPTPHTPPPSPV
jgi:hypothetical protein